LSTDSDKLAIEGGPPVRDCYLPYGRHEVTDADVSAVEEVLRSNRLTIGPKIAEFEQLLARTVEAPAAAAVSSGTAALHLAYLAAGIGPGDEVITSPLTFAATANAALYVGARPVFADVDDATLNLSPAAAEAAITEKTKAVVPVHYAGRSCEMEEFRDLCERRGLQLIEDASHAPGAIYNGSPVGSYSSGLATWSFHPVKHVAAGEGGAVTGNRELVERVRLLRNHGKPEPDPQAQTWLYDIIQRGYNYRLSDIGAALAASQLGRLAAKLQRRRELAALYAERLAGLEELRLPPADDAESVSAWHLYVVRLRLDRLSAGRAEVFAALRAENIGVQVHYVPVYRFTLYASCGHRGETTPVAEAAYEEIVTLPLFPAMTDGDLDDVVRALEKVLARYRSR
jgi:dTDP-4-amino-4,6-dideoxygalactose transaminase